MCPALNTNWHRRWSTTQNLSKPCIAYLSMPVCVCVFVCIFGVCLVSLCSRNTAKGKLGKFHFLKGATYTIPSVSLLNRREEGAQERQCVNLKVFCVASVVPSLPLKKGKMVPANRLCGSLYVSTSDTHTRTHT